MPFIGAALVGAALLICGVFARPALFLLLLSGMGLAAFTAALAPAARRDVGWRPAAIAAGLPVAAWFLPNVWLLYALSAVLVPALARRAGRIAPLYLFALFILPGLDLTLSVGSLKLFELGVHDALAFGAAGALLMRPRGRVPVALDLPVLALLATLVAALSRDTSATNALRVLLNLCLDAWLPYYILSRGVRDVDDARRCLLHLAAAAAVMSAVLLFEVWKAWPMYNVLYERFGVPVTLLVKSRGGMLRASGPFLEATSLAMVLVFCFLAAAAARDAFRSRLHHLAFLALLLVGLVPPQSRGAWIGLLTGLALIDLYRGRLRNTIVRMGLVVIAGLTLLTVAQGRPQLAETLGLSGGSADTVDYREQLLTRGLQELRQSPAVGFPLPEVNARLSDMTQGEGMVDFVNSYLFMALIGGAIGLAVFATAFLFPAVRLWAGRRGWRRRGAGEARIAAFAFAAAATPVQMLAFMSFGGRIQGFVLALLGFAAATIAIARADQRAKGSSAAVASSPPAAPTAAAANISDSSRRFSRPARPSAHQL